MLQAKAVIAITIATLLTGCATAQQHRAAVSGDDKSTISVGTVQREIKVGMSSAEVASILGSPNMVTTDEERREVWVYDKFATEEVYSGSGASGGIGAGGIIGATGVLGGLSGSSHAGAASRSQRTLTIIIKFDKNGNVRDYSYRQSKF